VSKPVTDCRSLGSLDCPNKLTLVFSVHFVLTRAHPRRTFRSVIHLQITLGQARLTESFWSEFLKKKVNLVDMSILSNLLSLGPRCHTLTLLEDRRPLWFPLQLCQY
jgi:hypothetical protein